MSLVHAMAQQARRPNGFFGRLFGFSMSRINRQANAWTLSQLALKKTDDVLEIGYGPGQAIQLLCAEVPEGRICGIDFSETMLQAATARNQDAIEAGLVELRVGDAASLPYPDASFDKVFCVNVIYFWPKPQEQLGEILRVLKPGGTLAIYMGDAVEMGGVKITQTGVFDLYPASDVMQMLKDVGFMTQRHATSAISQGPLSRGVCVLASKKPL